MGRGYNELPEDARSAREFFYSKRPECIHYRAIWFHLAGVTVPSEEGMPRCIKHMAGVKRKTGPKT